MSRYGHVELDETVHSNGDRNRDDENDLRKIHRVCIYPRSWYVVRGTYVDVTPAGGKGVFTIPTDVVEYDSCQGRPTQVIEGE